MNTSQSTCELVNTYEVLEHIMGIEGLHPHSLSTINELYENIVHLTEGKTGVILDVGCGSGKGTHSLSQKVNSNITIIGIDINNASIEKAQRDYQGENISFFHGTLDEFLNQQQPEKVLGIISVSVTMFIPNIKEFYKTAHAILDEGGFLIDAPFIFKHTDTNINQDFRQKTYDVCGCNMSMYTHNEHIEILEDAQIKVLKSKDEPFELMHLKTLSKDYGFPYLLRRFARNIISPPPALKGQKSSYLFKRTLSIFGFFMRNRSKYGAGVFIGVKE